MKYSSKFHRTISYLLKLLNALKTLSILITPRPPDDDFMITAKRMTEYKWRH